MTNKAKNSFLVIITILILFLVGELSLRIYHTIKWDAPFLVKWGAPECMYLPIKLSYELGWESRPNYTFSGVKKSSDGSIYNVDINFDSNGFRAFGDVHSNKIKVLVIGDSGTQAIEVSDNETYYSLLGKLLNVEIFAYGCGAFGTLQEYMILDKYIDIIKPDILLWQYCQNDFSDNSVEFEKKSKYRQGRLRPYWVDGEIKYQIPVDNFLWLRIFATRNSRLLYILFYRLNNFLVPNASSFIEDAIQQRGFSNKIFGKSIIITDEIMAGVKKRMGGIQIVSFSANAEWPYLEAFGKISKNNNIHFINNVGKSIIDAKETGAIVRSIDNMHWNNLGHKIVADCIVMYFRKNFGFK
ncbi:MAG: SGNH/GDSL hydrolase family protein [PVC group bacterium]|nr:SGNH/GDSL hydrolase family protein [PVC group bacterium]